jgi:hypothetical protein
MLVRDFPHPVISAWYVPIRVSGIRCAGRENERA